MLEGNSPLAVQYSMIYITYTSSLSIAGRVAPAVLRVDRRGNKDSGRSLVSILSDGQHIIVRKEKLKCPTGSVA